MTESVTIGALAASALAMAAEAALKGGVGEAAKDAYNALKGNIAKWASGDLVALEKTPTSATRQAVIAEEIGRQSSDDQANIRILALALIEALEKNARGGPIGIDIGRLDAMRVQFGAITVTEGTGFISDNVTVTDDFTTGPITVGQPLGKSKR